MGFCTTGLPLLLAVCALAAAGCSAAAPGGGGARSEAPAKSTAGRPERAPDFTLSDPDGKSHSLAGARGKWVVLEWTNPGCPFVKKHYESKNMQQLQARYTGQGVVWYTMASSSAGKQGSLDAAAWKAQLAKDRSSPTALLIDSDSRVGRLYQAKTTPHMFVIDPSGNIVYRGAIDDKSGPDSSEIVSARNYVAETLDAGLAGRPVTVTETAPYGCSVKY